MANVPLVRTEGKLFTGATSVTPLRLVREPLLLRESKTDATREVERAFDLGDCLYFYAGHACPDFGDVVFVYEPDWSEDASGSATPFDTGGAYTGKIAADGLDAGAAGKAYVDGHKVELSAWRAALDTHIVQYFESPGMYVLGSSPRTDDPTHRLLRPGNQRRAWTWEVRLHQDHPVHLHLRLLCMTSDFAEQLRIAVLDLPPDEARAWDDVLDHRSLWVHAADRDPHVATRAERWIVSWL
jgi:hypothetical protein